MKQKCIAETLQTQGSVRGIRVAVKRKNSPTDLLLRQLREYYLYSKLRSLLPREQPLEEISSSIEGDQVATEYEPPIHEIPGGDSDEESAIAIPPQQEEEQEKEKQEEEDEEGEEEEEMVDVTQEAFVPSIKIKRMEKALLISTVVLKHVALSSGLFRLLEEEKLDLIFENQYRTETKVSHTIQVRTPSEYDVDALEIKLQTWATTGTHV
ncbi:hypothetical protein CKAN_02409700 [Cinnamomum micranthum f. kanehirae]|uniref:Uncharacterized protein n=1 Tax=Cinnamomum micranthum f. kanehirae TaxID=337451 RepID=A0A443PVJ4_9MAGN|nr:hypothetical protein CKAN_02409700 [Cinnamomum micranthum f. kanehirae]